MATDTVITIACAIMIALVAIVALIGWLWLYFLRAKAVLRAWATKGGFQILAFQKTNITGRGPFNWWTNSPNQAIYHIRVRDREGRERSAWVRCGSYFGGVLFSNKAEVRWEVTREPAGR
jgi:hypothetical protein